MYQMEIQLILKNMAIKKIGLMLFIKKVKKNLEENNKQYNYWW